MLLSVLNAFQIFEAGPDTVGLSHAIYHFFESQYFHTYHDSSESTLHSAFCFYAASTR